MTPEQRFWAKVDKTANCWLWTAATMENGYGRFDMPEKQWLVHRLAYTLTCGPIADGLVVDHLCRVRNCVNPAHLEAVPQTLNILRGDNPEVTRARHLARTHCKRGHEFTPENTKQRIDGRVCRACMRIHDRAAKARRKAAA